MLLNGVYSLVDYFSLNFLSPTFLHTKEVWKVRALVLMSTQMEIKRESVFGRRIRESHFILHILTRFCWEESRVENFWLEFKLFHILNASRWLLAIKCKPNAVPLHGKNSHAHNQTLDDALPSSFFLQRIIKGRKVAATSVSGTQQTSLRRNVKSGKTVFLRQSLGMNENSLLIWISISRFYYITKRKTIKPKNSLQWISILIRRIFPLFTLLSFEHYHCVRVFFLLRNFFFWYFPWIIKELYFLEVSFAIAERRSTNFHR